ncbi:electron transport complex subunit RsxG [Dickeya lacustris]|uniref:Ion-translocating oxidoreductase complex subunit G n=1 Tax=Dickeya lacustris TaxID=2259638 RepID=A0ABY8GBU6_9GAMM|nr:electron transport complex subunit RsxG [Dickeya lacustris]WFN57496.1 electron transport complex subunit RsxG [Dickeya lacustris]
MLTTMRRHATTLAIFAAVTTGLTALVNVMTERTISQQVEAQQRALLAQVLPADRYTHDLLAECYQITDSALGSAVAHRVYIARRDGEPVAAALESTAPDGYSGAIQLLIGADFQGNVLGVRVTEHHETPGLGDKIDIRISEWVRHFSGKTVQGVNDSRWAVKKDGGQFDQFTGATITPRAVVNAVKRGTLWLQTLPPQLSQLRPCGEKP